ncbi:MAG: hypothetical protein HY840_00865 [Bacteroidetes bacterium]|nr:hypothetical protein [Bacteroidota bacterium]
MATKPKTPIRHILAVLNMPKPIGDKIVKAQFIQKSLTGNSSFPVPYPANIISLAQLGTDIAALVAAETNSRAHTAGTADARNAVLQTVIADLRNIMSMVQAAADKLPATAENIILGAGYDVKKVSPRQKQDDEATEGDVSGTVLLTASGGGAHEWQMSKDQLAITNLPATTTAHTTVENLIPGDIFYFRNRPILKNGRMGNWCDWIKFMIR